MGIKYLEDDLENGEKEERDISEGSREMRGEGEGRLAVKQGGDRERKKHPG